MMNIIFCGIMRRLPLDLECKPLRDLGWALVIAREKNGPFQCTFQTEVGVGVNTIEEVMQIESEAFGGMVTARAVEAVSLFHPCCIDPMTY